MFYNQSIQDGKKESQNGHILSKIIFLISFFVKHSLTMLTWKVGHKFYLEICYTLVSWKRRFVFLYVVWSLKYCTKALNKVIIRWKAIPVSVSTMLWKFLPGNEVDDGNQTVLSRMARKVHIGSREYHFNS